MDHARRLASPLLAVALLSGCDIAEKIPQSPQDLQRLTSPFGLATRELIEETPEGKVYRVRIESRRAASWNHADFAMWETLQHSCPDGEKYETLSTKPATVAGSVDGGASSRQEWPAGTLFVRTVRCAPTPPYEFQFEASVTSDEAYRQMIRRLFQAAPDSQGEQLVQFIVDSPAEPKYKQIERLFGAAVHRKLADCPAGVVVTHPMIGVFPKTGDAKDRGRPNGYVGFVLECTDKPPAGASAGS